MKKSTLRLSAVVLACVPLLIGGASFVNAEDTQHSSSSEVVNKANTTASSTEAKETKENTSPVITKTLKVESNEISGKKGDSGKIKLAKIKLVDETANNEKEKEREVELKGTFELLEKNDFIKFDKDGNWTALNKTDKKEIQLDFKPNLKDEDTKKVLSAMFPSETFDDAYNKTIKTDKITVNFTDPKPIIDPTVDPVALDVAVKNKGNKLVVTHENTELKATFTELKNDKANKIVLGSDGTFTIPATNKETKFTQKVDFVLDKEDTNFKKLSETKNIKTEYKNIDASINTKVIALTYKTPTLTSKINAGGKLEFQDVEGVKITGKFQEVKNDDYFSLDADGNWKAKKAGRGDVDPTFTISDTSLAELQKKYPEQLIQITTGKLKVDFSETGSNQKEYAPVSKKEYAPVKKLPQTGEEKMRFAGIIGIIVIAIVGIIFFMKKKKNDDDEA
ncbi:MAG: LPXTG cell wall anchor domain-containing protein [Vagococcus sp.]|uniref:LPXTG cell wall anchor domain-containing protein n=1 Tax=Vagococcus sp. TaxID=1933889 RepID=UPI002FC92789